MIGVPSHAISHSIVSYFPHALQRWIRRRVAQLESLIVVIIAAIAVYIVFKILTGIIRFIISLAIIGGVIFLLAQFLS